MKRVPLATFHEVQPAQQLQQRLARAGVDATVHDDSRLQRLWFVSQPRAAIHVEVPQPDYLGARELIEEWQKTENVLERAVRCPACHSARVEYPQLTRKFVTPSLGSVLMAIGLIRREFYCLDCHYTWPAEILLEPRRDPLGWPAESKLWHPKESAGKH